jgi:hypothetical protein
LVGVSTQNAQIRGWSSREDGPGITKEK